MIYWLFIHTNNDVYQWMITCELISRAVWVMHHGLVFCISVTWYLCNTSHYEQIVESRFKNPVPIVCGLIFDIKILISWIQMPLRMLSVDRVMPWARENDATKDYSYFTHYTPVFLLMFCWLAGNSLESKDIIISYSIYRRYNLQWTHSFWHIVRHYEAMPIPRCNLFISIVQHF